MNLDIRYVNLPVSDALEEFTRTRMARALRPFRGHVERITVRLEDINGPRGGLDKRCSVTAELAAVKRKVVVENKSSDAYDAVQEACARLAEAVGRALTRRRRKERFGTPVPAGAAAPPSAPAPSPGREPPRGSEAAVESRLMVTAADHQRLRGIIDAWSGTRDKYATEALSDELDRAEVVPAERIAGNIVTMNSRVVFKDEETGESREVSLVYPHESDPALGRVSILAPIGSALLGLSVGQTIDWPLPNGRLKRMRVVRILYQPEEAGHLHL
jgi:regulator of nucleoside diphosphate kinase